MRNRVVVPLDPVVEVDFVEADVGVHVFARGGRTEREEGALGHGRQRVRCLVALGSRAYCPGARGVVLGEQVADCVAVGDCWGEGLLAQGCWSVFGGLTEVCFEGYVHVGAESLGGDFLQGGYNVLASDFVRTVSNVFVDS